MNIHTFLNIYTRTQNHMHKYLHKNQVNKQNVYNMHYRYKDYLNITNYNLINFWLVLFFYFICLKKNPVIYLKALNISYYKKIRKNDHLITITFQHSKNISTSLISFTLIIYVCIQ